MAKVLWVLVLAAIACQVRGFGIPDLISNSEDEDSSKCAGDGLYSNPKNCSSFIQCSNGIKHVMPCPKGLHFSTKTERCETPCDAHCDRTYACRCNWLTCDKQICFLPNKAGPCNETSQRYYFDKRISKCVNFTYGGCRGNENNFLSKTECEKACGETINDICRLPSETGPCKGHIESYFFNHKTGQCEKFIYGGCRGNSNRFDSREQCEQKCLRRRDAYVAICRLPKDSGPCQLNYHRFYYNHDEDRCIQFRWGGCDGNANNFMTRRICEIKCARNPAQEDSCALPAETGSCKARIPRYFYDKSTGLCVPFVYGGCDGNANNFETKSECEEKCGATVDVCQLPKEPGPCQASFRRWWFNPEAKKCEQFVYGGCRGNGNNFATEADCEKRCPTSGNEAQRTLTDVDPADQAEAADIGCGKDGLYPLDTNCSVFIQCTNGQPVVMPCPKGLHYSPKTKRCEQPCDAHCDRTQACKCGWKTCGKQSCKLRAKTGSCTKFSPRYYYDRDSKKCKPFLYSGCLGNENNFVAKKDCQKVCNAKRALSGAEPECESPSEVGPCRGRIPRYYYDQETKKCVKFFYGGCGGNGNNYETINECQAQCSKHTEVVQHTDSEPECDSAPDVGPCKARIPRYYYDKKTKKCVKFTYGGCGGNANNYESLDECYAQCFEEKGKSDVADALPEYCEYEPEPGSCDLDMTRFYYDPAAGKCKEFKFGGCWGNENNFHTKELCDEKCTKRKGSVVVSDALPEYCELDPETGPCKANITKFYYDHAEKECKEFQYGGCQGNRNSFYSKEMCEKRCKDKDTEEEESAAWDALPEYCELDPETGPCHANVTKFYYDHEEEECKEFQYGGCGGNLNSFYSKELCERKCKSKKESDGDKSADLKCPDFNGDFAIPHRCHMFLRCEHLVPEIKECPSGQLFDFFQKQCVEAEKAHCLL